MTGSALNLAAGLLAAVHEEPSKTPFYVAGGLFAVWAVVVSAIGLRNADFPASGTVARVVMGISVAGLLATTAAAVATSTKPKPEHEAEAAAEESPAAAGEAAGGEAAAGEGAAIPLVADPSGQLRYDKQELSAKAGKVAIALTNSSTTPHNVVIEKDGKKVAGSEAIVQSKVTLTASLTPGDYTFYCSVSTHRQAGMEGDLTVE